MPIAWSSARIPALAPYPGEALPCGVPRAARAMTPLPLVGQGTSRQDALQHKAAGQSVTHLRLLTLTVPRTGPPIWPR